MFGMFGINGVSLRQIAMAAGQRNNSAVTLHFGSKEGLIKEIIATRTPQIDRLRDARYRRLTASGKIDVRGLVEALVMPWIDDVDESGDHPYARLITQLMWEDASFNPAEFLPSLTPAANALTLELRAMLPDLSEEQFSFRTRLMIGMFLTMAIHDGQHLFGDTYEKVGGSTFDKIIDIIVSVLQARQEAR
jgi:AcrR family transcriptional regulator